MRRSYIVIFLFFSAAVYGQDSHKLWLQDVEAEPVTIMSSRNSPIIDKAKEELRSAWKGSPNSQVQLTIIRDKNLHEDGFILTDNEIQAKTDLGLLYGTFELLRHQHTGKTVARQVFNPSYQFRILNHWDNPDASVERGYAGRSIFWKGDTLTVDNADRIRWREYARANASVGINGSVINNVNATPRILRAEYLARVKVVADIFREYGIKTYLAVNFASPSVIGGLDTADPLDPDVREWWKDKTDEIYELIPDFGGFLVKANSEGQPGPQNFGRTHADGANMLAEAVEPHGGIVMWRAFVYSPNDEDRAKQAYQEFMPFDGEFMDNVIIQVKNGPVDFQPREPFSPLFGAMKKTSVMPELQITQEYLGHSVHLVFLSSMWEEFLKTDTYSDGPGSSVAKCTDGSIYPQTHTAIAGVANTGRDDNWNGHLFAQSNWYAFGRLAWDNQLSSDQIAEEWLRLTFKPQVSGKEITDIEWEQQFLKPVKKMMLESHEAAVNYMTPLGLHHIMSADRHYGPGPWWGPEQVRPDWTPPYYHQAGEDGIGFNRSESGSNAVAQYSEPLRSLFNDPETCPESYLLWFHHLPWTYELSEGRTLWEELAYHYEDGVNQVRKFQEIWDRTEPYVAEDPFHAVQRKLRAQAQNAIVWKDACLLYFGQFSKLPIPYNVERPVHNLDDLIRQDYENMMSRFRNSENE